jgi:hypothetical protein
MDLEVCEVKLVEEQACGMHFFNGWDLLAEMEALHVHIARVEDEHTTEAGEMSVLVIEGSNALVDLGMLPIRDIPQLPKMAQEILKAIGVILERL